MYIVESPDLTDVNKVDIAWKLKIRLTGHRWEFSIMIVAVWVALFDKH